MNSIHFFYLPLPYPNYFERIIYEDKERCDEYK